ncbi:hypothetical protein HanXRQr2_Chr01g0021791 [Helianthus annuus]|uniref:Uncharacterized protein n=1 Tax=Helianthus annuus TaxID=4232 RepID=A0A9K3JVT5_HELAN|nr:hypothetical protein HanXRQr2_Chr01g0021791 [Helianthus annuus]KAJ0956902.1 hypothetical protein HanPSC8_Chr01g0021001 [Helianthus annuus]
MDLLSGSAGVVMNRDSWMTYKRCIDFDYYHETITKRFNTCFRYTTFWELISC